MALDERDYLEVLDVARALNDVADPDEFGRAALARIGSLVWSDVVSINDVDPAAGRFVYAMLPEDFPIGPDGQQRFVRTAGEHPLVSYVARTGDGSAHKISDFLTRDDWHATSSYREFYQPIGIEHQMSVGLPAPRPTVVAIALSRAEIDFDERDRVVLDLLRPFLAQAWRNARERALVRSLLDSVSGVLTAHGAAVIVLDDPLIEVTPGALTSLYRFFGRPAPRNPLPHRVMMWLEAQRHRLGHTDAPRLAKPLAATIEDRRLVLRYVPGTQRQRDAIVLRETPEEQVVTQLRATGLTRREVEVVRLVATGATNAQIADVLHVSAWTVKRHLDHVYAKLGVRGRVQAAAAARDLVSRHVASSGDTPIGVWLPPASADTV